MTEVVHYSAEDGLNVLNYLGITNITDSERKEFIDKWEGVYEMRGCLISAVSTLYASVLPFVCGNGESGSLLVSRIRDSDFHERLKTTNLAEDLKQGKTLTEILKQGPHKFLKRVFFTDLDDYHTIK